MKIMLFMRLRYHSLFNGGTITSENGFCLVCEREKCLDVNGLIIMIDDINGYGEQFFRITKFHVKWRLN